MRCIWNEKGKCRNGDQCRFAHGLGELRLNQKPESTQEKRSEKLTGEKVEKEAREMISDDLCLFFFIFLLLFSDIF